MDFENEWKSSKKSSYLEQLSKLPRDKVEAEHNTTLIVKEINDIKIPTGDCTEFYQGVYNRLIRAYYNILHKYCLEDKHYNDFATQFNVDHEHAFNILHGILLIKRLENSQAEILKNKCSAALHTAIANNQSVLTIIKCMNLLMFRVPDLELYISLEDLYLCLQSKQIGMTSETLKLTMHCCQARTVSFEYFGIIVEFWPWSNRHKYTILSFILKKYSLNELLHNFERSELEFLQGLRLSLSYKQLLAVSQDLVRSLLSQECENFLQLCVDILSTGSLHEVQNFNANWYKHFNDKQKDALFEKLKQLPDIYSLLQIDAVDKHECKRAVFIFKMFAKQSFDDCKLNFFRISTALITDCFQFDLDTQLNIYQFVVDNLNYFAIEDILDFILAFVQQHKCNDNPRFRNTLLHQMPLIFSCIAKANYKQYMGSTLGSSIVEFFTQIQQQIECDIISEEYQSQIFALKLLHTLYTTIYAEQLTKMTKQCTIMHNQQLGRFLQQHEVFQVKKVQALLLKQLSNANGYDDAWELSVTLLKHMHYEQIDESFSRCLEFCKNLNIDECQLSQFHAKVVVDSCLRNQENKKCLYYFEKILELLMNTLKEFSVDPLYVCHTKNHIFGYINVLTELIKIAEVECYNNLLNCVEELVNIILNMLNLVNINSAADFQDMDESLQILIEKSSKKIIISEQTQTRKFLLLSFWYTLKSSCHVVLGVAQQIVKRNIQQNLLSKCFDIHMAILTRCRHKGAIEAAGLSIGHLTNLTAKLKDYNLLQQQLDVLFNEDNQVSTTRRGAGFSITLLHIVKQDAQEERPLLKYAMGKIFSCIKQSKDAANSNIIKNYDLMDALVLHYLCVLVKDAELRYALLPYYNEIMLAAIQQIDNKEWTVCNAALQLFGALAPKILGQKQAIQLDCIAEWEPGEITYADILQKMPKACHYILDYCGGSQSGTRAIVLYLNFLANVEHLQLTMDVQDNTTRHKFCILFWQLLSHSCEKVRKLAAKCFVRAHEIRCELPNAVLRICEMLFDVEDENFFIGLVFTLKYGLAKLQYEALHTLINEELKQILTKVNISLSQEFKNLNKFKPYTLHIFIELLKACNQNKQIKYLESTATSKTNEIGYDLSFLHLNEVII